MTPEAGVKINSARFVPSSFTMSKFTYVKLLNKGLEARGGEGVIVETFISQLLMQCLM